MKLFTALNYKTWSRTKTGVVNNACPIEFEWQLNSVTLHALASINFAITVVFVSVSGSSPLQIEFGQDYCMSQAAAVYTINILIYIY